MKRTIMMLVPALALVACAKGADTAADTSAAEVTATPVGATTQTAAPPDVAQQSGLLDPNTATREQLMAAPGMDSAAVAAVVASRPYADMLAVDAALPKSTTADQRKALYARVWKPIDLNTAKPAEILLIPGVGNRMLREFNEYRPYRTMEQFRRDIGKYVDKTELARLEQYVSIK